MRSGTCPFISPFMDKRIFLPKESTRHSSLDKKTMKNNNNLVQSRSQFWQTRAINVIVCKWVRQRKGTLYLSYLIKSLRNFQKPNYKNKKLLSCRTVVCQRELVTGKVFGDLYMRRCIYCSSTIQNKMWVVLLILITLWKYSSLFNCNFQPLHRFEAEKLEELE